MEDKRITLVVDGDKAEKIIEIQTILMKKEGNAVSFGKVLNMCLVNGVDSTLKKVEK